MFKARETFKENLNYFMKIRDVSQRDLVLHLGVTASVVSDWVTGKSYPRIEAMQKIADYLDVSISDLNNPEMRPVSCRVYPAYSTDSDEHELLQILDTLDRHNRHLLMAYAYKLRKENPNG